MHLFQTCLTCHQSYFHSSHSTDTPSLITLLSKFFCLRFPAASPTGTPQTTLIFHISCLDSHLPPWSCLCSLHHIIGWSSHCYSFCLSLRLFTHGPASSFSEPNLVDAFPDSYTCLTSSHPHSWLCQPHASLFFMLKQVFLVSHVLHVGADQSTLKI